jgi:hypothetical protein
MSNAAFQITFRGGEPLSGTVRFDPGSRLEGLVQIIPAENIRAKRVLVRVGWHTEGRGDRNSGAVGELQIAQGNLTANTPLAQSFSLDLPTSPWSFAGHYVSIIWLVRVTIDVPFGGDIEAMQPFVVAPKMS